jgi:hypothetical protein
MMTCDCNASPATATHAGLPAARLPAAGLKDSWLRGEPGQPGFTCCQIRDGSLKAAGDQIVGPYPACRSVPGGFWPSDYAGLIAELARGTRVERTR